LRSFLFSRPFRESSFFDRSFDTDGSSFDKLAGILRQLACEMLANGLMSPKKTNVRTSGKTKILWAVDIAAPDRKIQEAAVGWLKTLSTSGVSIEPFYLLKIGESRTPTKSGSGKLTDLRLPAEKALQEWLSRIRCPGLTAPSILAPTGVYLRSDIDALNRYAIKTGAEVIVLTTHARKGFSRFWLGSFAETLLLHSKVPVFLINPNTKAPQAIKQILFSTNLTNDSKSVFKRVVRLAKRLGARITLLNKSEYYPELMRASLRRSYLDHIQKDTILRKRTLTFWANWAKKHGVLVTVVMDDSNDLVVDSVLRHLKKMKSPIIAMASQTGGFASSLVGSTTRKVVRNSPCPVWVFHPR